MNKKVENSWKKVFWPAFGCTQHPKADRNTQQIFDELFLVDYISQGYCLSRYQQDLSPYLSLYFLSQVILVVDCIQRGTGRLDLRKNIDALSDAYGRPVHRAPCVGLQLW